MSKLRTIAAVLASLMFTGAAGCGSRTVSGDSRSQAPYSTPDQPRQGMSNQKKVLLLAGAAALYYMWKKNQNKPASAVGPEGKYYRSKNGRVYYRDAQGQAHWVSEPSQPIEVPADEYQRYFGRGPSGPGGVIRDAPAF